LVRLKRKRERDAKAKHERGTSNKSNRANLQIIAQYIEEAGNANANANNK